MYIITLENYRKNERKGIITGDADDVSIYQSEMVDFVIESSKLLERIANSSTSSSKELTSKRVVKIDYNNDSLAKCRDTKQVRKKLLETLTKKPEMVVVSDNFKNSVDKIQQSGPERVFLISNSDLPR